MKIILIRHGESTANEMGVLSSYPDDDVVLTKAGRAQVDRASRMLPKQLDIVYTSPLKRTLETTDILLGKRPINIIVEPRVKEVDYGIYSGGPNNAGLDRIRQMQVRGDYTVRFGSNGENKLDVLNRLYEFLIEVIETNNDKSNVLIVTHGSIVSRIESILSDIGVIDKKSGADNAEVREYSLAKKDALMLQRLKLIDNMLAAAKDLKKIFAYRNYYVDIAKRVDDPELTLDVIEQFFYGLCVSEIVLVQKSKGNRPECINEDSPIVVCSLHNSAMLIELFINHYLNIGIKNFVFIDNNSDDSSVDSIKKMSKGLHIDIWRTNDRFDGFKAMGWKQRLFYTYGLNRWYLNLDIDELLVLQGYEDDGSIDGLISDLKQRSLISAGSVLIDMYSKGLIYNKSGSENILVDYRFFDLDSYEYEKGHNFGRRIFGGPRTRVIGRHPSLQNTPLVYVTNSSIAINPHFWIPYSISVDAPLCTAMLHYKFLPGDIDRYRFYVDSGVHWDNSSQYRSYVDHADNNKYATFYDDRHSAEFTGYESVASIKYSDGSRVVEGLVRKAK